MINLAFLFFAFAFLQDDTKSQTISPEARAVISKFIDAKGGDVALKKIKNWTMKGEVSFSGEMLATFESYQAVNRHLSIDRFPDGSSRRHGTDGKIAWRLDVDGTPAILKGQEAQDYMRHYSTLHESLEWTSQFRAILYAGKKLSDREPVHHLIFVAADNHQINRYFSETSGFLIREEQVIFGNGRAQMLISEISDYTKQPNGTFVSRSRLNHFGSDYSVEYKVNSVEANAITDENIFEVPKAVKDLMENKQQNDSSKLNQSKKH